MKHVVTVQISGHEWVFTKCFDHAQHAAGPPILIPLWTIIQLLLFMLLTVYQS